MFIHFCLEIEQISQEQRFNHRNNHIEYLVEFSFYRLGLLFDLIIDSLKIAESHLKVSSIYHNFLHQQLEPAVNLLIESGLFIEPEPYLFPDLHVLLFYILFEFHNLSQLCLFLFDEVSMQAV